MGNLKEEFSVKNDGTIVRTPESMDARILNIIRIGANKTNLLAAYKAQKKCFKICKQQTQRIDYKEYVECLQLDNYRDEFKKAELGRKFCKQLWWLLLIIPTVGFGLIVLPLLIIRMKKIANEIRSIKN